MADTNAVALARSRWANAFPAARRWHLSRSRLNRKLVGLGIPIAIQTSVFVLLGLIDRVMVGQLGESAINATSVASQVTGVIGTVAGMATLGVGVLAAQLVGANDRVGFLRVAVNGFHVALAAGVAASLALVAGAGGIAAAMLPPDQAETTALAATYLRIVGGGFAAAMLGGLGTALLQGTGDTKSPMYVSALGVATNTGLNWLLIFGNWGLPAMGVAGAAWATLATQVSGAAILLLLAAARLRRWHPDAGWSALRPSWREIKRVASIGAPITLDGIAWRGATLAYSAILARAGGVALAAYMIAQAARGILFLPLMGVAQGAGIAIGQDLGAGRERRAQATVAAALRLGMGANIVLAFATALFAEQATSLFEVAPETRRWAVACLRFIAALQLLETLNTILPFALRAGGDAQRVFQISATTFWLVGVPLALVLGLGLKWGLAGVLLGMAAESLAKAALLAWRFLGGRWRRRLV